MNTELDKTRAVVEGQFDDLTVTTDVNMNGGEFHINGAVEP